MNNEQWSMNNEQWSMNNEQQTMINGQWTVTNETVTNETVIHEQLTHQHDGLVPEKLVTMFAFLFFTLGGVLGVLVAELFVGLQLTGLCGRRVW
jgi:hypothetical protein